MGIIGFVKVGQKEHIESFRKDGLLYMNTLECYRTCEGMSRDKSEGTRDILQGKKAKFAVFPQNGPPAPIRGAISFESTRLEDLKKNVFCMHSIKDGDDELGKKNFHRADYTLLIYNCRAFIYILEECKQKNKLSIIYGPVEYVDKNTYNGPLGCFKKYKEYENEREFRILLEPGEGKPFQLYIGNLENISTIVPAEDAPNIIKDKFNL